jgi:hypothetical protein
MTSIEWLIDQMFKQGYFDGNKPLSITNLDHLQQQAVKMHKEEIKNAWQNRNQDVIKSDGKTAEQYYQETFGSKGSDDHIADISKMVEVPQQEITDGEIQSTAETFWTEPDESDMKRGWKLGAKWYREQLKQK